MRSQWQCVGVIPQKYCTDKVHSVDLYILLAPTQYLKGAQRWDWALTSDGTIPPTLLKLFFQEQETEGSPMFERSYVWSIKNITHRRPSFPSGKNPLRDWGLGTIWAPDRQGPLFRGWRCPTVIAMPLLADLCCHAEMYFINRHQLPPGQQITSACIGDQTSIRLQMSQVTQALPSMGFSKAACGLSWNN